MNRNWFVTCAVMMVAGAVLFGGWRVTQAESMEHHGEKGEQLHETMEHMGKLFKQVRGAMNDPAKMAEGADAVAKMEALVVEAKTLEPEKVEKMPADQQAAAMKAYRLDMCALLGRLSELEAAMVQGDQAKAQTAMGEVVAVMKKGHEAFREKED